MVQCACSAQSTVTAAGYYERPGPDHPSHHGHGHSDCHGPTTVTGCSIVPVMPVPVALPGCRPLSESQARDQGRFRAFGLWPSALHTAPQL